MKSLTVMIKPASDLCNFQCTYCFYHDVASHREIASRGIMDDETLENIVRKAFRYADTSISFLFQGGEPLLAGKAFFKNYLKLIEKYNGKPITVQSSIQTNGSYIDKEWIDIFKEGHFLVGVSLDGTEEIHDTYRIAGSGAPTYRQVCENLCLLKKHQIDYNILCVVTKEIAQNPAKVFHALKEHRYLQFIPCLDSFDSKAHDFSLDSVSYGNFLIGTYDLYEKEIYKRNFISIRTFDNWLSILLGGQPENCAMLGVCGVYYLIEADGSVYPCDFYCLDPWNIGNINQSSFYRLEKSELAKTFRDASLPIDKECQSCLYYSLCRGGCRRDREIPGGSLSKNRLCKGHKLFFKECLDRMIKLASFF